MSADGIQTPRDASRADPDIPTTPLVTVLVPARNEETDIGSCLDAVAAQDYPRKSLEVLVVDGGSVDRTASVARERLAAKGLGGHVVPNPSGTTPSNLNAGLAEARGEVVCRVDARSLIPPEYVRRCVETLANRPDVVVTGGAQVAVAPNPTVVGRGIARALNNRLSMGASAYRSRGRSGATDTVYLGAFRTAQLRAVGGWNEAMLSNQDFELNRRLGRHGVVWFDSRLEVGYVPRSTLPALWKQYRRFGRWKVKYWRATGDSPQPRQLVLMIVPVATAALVAAFVATGRRRLVRLAYTTGWTALGLVAIDHVGSQSRPEAVRVRLASCVAISSVSCGWLTGAAAEALSGICGATRAGHDQPDKGSRYRSRTARGAARKDA